MERAQIELAPELARRFRAELLELQGSDLVGQRLARRHDVTVDLVAHVERRLGIVLQEVIDGLLPIPLHRVHPGIDHQPDRPPHLVRQLPELRVRIAVEPHVVSQRLGVERPPLDERRGAQVPPEGRQPGAFFRKSDLQVMPGDALVHRERHHFPDGPRVGLVEVHEVGPRPRAVSRWFDVIRRGRVGSDARRHRLDAVGRSRERLEELHEQRIDSLRRRAVGLFEVRGVLVEEARIGSQLDEEVLERPLEPYRCHLRLHLAANPGDLSEADVVDLLDAQRFVVVW